MVTQHAIVLQYYRNGAMGLVLTQQIRQLTVLMHFSKAEL